MATNKDRVGLKIVDVKHSESKPKKGHGHRWKKGESGNPKGRPKKGHTLTDVLNAELDKMAIAKDGKPIKDENGEPMTQRALLVKRSIIAAIKGDNYMVKFVADRSEGKAVERVMDVSAEFKDDGE